MPRGGTATGRMVITDGIKPWFDGPEWDDVAAKAMDTMVSQVEETARANAIWEDRTGDARASLHAGIEHDGGEVILYLEHGVEYGYWLEVIQNGHFAIIMPTLEEQAPRLLRNATRRVRYARKGRN